jgi:excisionase family DNA binding protein
MTVSEAARRLARSIDAVYKLVWAGKLKATRRGENWDIDEDAVEARLKTQRNLKRKQLAKAS